MCEQVGPRRPCDRSRGVANLREQVDMTEVTSPEQGREPGAKMTLRVYSMSRSGKVTKDRGTLRVTGGQEPPPSEIAFPPCQCPRHRKQRAAR
jgi:hypothetical protein